MPAAKPGRDEYLLRAEDNALFAEHIANHNDQRFFGWAITALFYAAAMYGRAYLKSKGVAWQPTHDGFTYSFARTCSNRRLFRHYEKMRCRSESTRYDCVNTALPDIATVRNVHFTPFRDGVLRLISRP